ncbi:RNA polymerase III RPC4-domain-containing protein [Xylaria intraflava]|nr:RNA polymerase III RPC4-domain-containing protein [Xylaria intraflava]
MPAAPRGGERGGRGTRSGRGGRGRGASSQNTASQSSASEPASAPRPPSQIGESIQSGAQNASVKSEAAARVTRTAAANVSGGASTPADLRPSQASAATSRGASRFKPKNVRRDEAERRKLEEDRNRDLAVKVKIEERELRAEERRARRGRGRGGMARGGLTRRIVTASGPFSAIAAENVKTDGVRASGSGSWQGNERYSLFRYDSENRIRYQPRREHEARINIDLLNGLTDGHAPDGTPLYQPTRYTQKSVGNIPIGMHRTLHQDPEVKVKTQAELEAEDRQSSDDEGGLFVDAPVADPRDVGMNNDNEIWHAAPKDRVNVKAEPGTEEDCADVDMAEIPEAPTTATSPDTKRRAVIDENGLASDTATEKMKRREKRIAEDPEFMCSTMDLETVLRSLSFSAPAEGEEGQEKDDQLFVFQFPPILPPLIRPSDNQNGSEAIDLAPSNSENDIKVKLENGIEEIRKESMGLPADGGFIGRLNVRKSGKVELDWGGTTLDLGVATETDFLTTAMIIEQKENVETAEESAGSAYGMGQVLGKFVLAPPCEDENEWDPNIDEIMRLSKDEVAI